MSASQLGLFAAVGSQLAEGPGHVPIANEIVFVGIIFVARRKFNECYGLLIRFHQRPGTRSKIKATVPKEMPSNDEK